ncbi:MAG: sigma-70 family RNA polymerase sigma factor [Actinobacteria bacterium]|nr:sigma-70 family RNA polymerase sigma factor [Actinomycetota bacterium]
MTYPRLVGALGLVCGSRAAAEDAVLEALARAWERSERGERIENAEAWVTAVAMNLARSGLRRVRAERRARERMAGRPATGGAGPEAAEDVRRALAKLPRGQREATVLRYYLDLDVGEVATVLGVSEGTVKTQLHRARATLGRLLGEHDPEEADDVAR